MDSTNHILIATAKIDGSRKLQANLSTKKTKILFFTEIKVEGWFGDSPLSCYARRWRSVRALRPQGCFGTPSRRFLRTESPLCLSFSASHGLKPRNKRGLTEAMAATPNAPL